MRKADKMKSKRTKGKKVNTAPDPNQMKKDKADTLNERMAKLENQISQTGKMDKDEAIVVMYLALFDEDSIYNIKVLQKTVNAMDKKLKNLNDYNVELEAKIKILELDSHQTKIILKNIPLMDEKDNKEN